MKLGPIRSLLTIAAALLITGGHACAQELSRDLARAELPPGYAAAMAQTYTPHVKRRGIDAVQWAVNNRRYVAEAVNTWDPAGLWEQGGDCEDFALAKIKELQAQGFTGLYLLVARNLKTAEGHAVAVVAENGVWYVLDNQQDKKQPLGDFLVDWAFLYVIDVDKNAAYSIPNLALAHAD